MLQGLRSTLFLVGQLGTAILFTPFAIIAYPLSPVSRSRFIANWARFVIWWLRVTCGLTHRVTGLENLPQRPSVILSKHQSAWETIAFQLIFPAQAWVLKRELLWIPFFGWGLAATQPIAIDRRYGMRALETVISAGVQRLREGRWVVVFPEGTRLSPGKRRRYNVGGATLAAKAGVPVVPVAHNSGTFWPRRGLVKRPGVIDVVIGHPIEPDGRGPKQVNAEAEAWIEETMVGLECTSAAAARARRG
ncbi:MAG: 1-acyl-sn-glycerol-3-phosphate acyltransferase [Gammaproteobacteria bacterium]|nr:1-acyl-sn-glycerol-3-phosphate acyltransferase [Gammaproteobacteria bacterium]